jgi:hypothetical protein
MNNLKSDIINGAFSLLRISGITSKPSAEDLALALGRLEGMARELYKKNIYTSYNFEDEPDLNSVSGVSLDLFFAFETLLAVRLMSDFGKGKELDQALINNANQQMAYMINLSVQSNVYPVNFPNTHPVGGGNYQGFRYRKYFSDTLTYPSINTSKKIYPNDVNFFVEYFNSYLKNEETLVDYEILADPNLTVLESSLNLDSVSYKLKADASAYSNITIKVETSLGRKVTRLIEFMVQ